MCVCLVCVLCVRRGVRRGVRGGACGASPSSRLVTSIIMSSTALLSTWPADRARIISAGISSKHATSLSSQLCGPDPARGVSMPRLARAAEEVAPTARGRRNASCCVARTLGTCCRRGFQDDFEIVHATANTRSPGGVARCGWKRLLHPSRGTQEPTRMSQCVCWKRPLPVRGTDLE